MTKDEALKLIVDVANGSTTANSLQHISQIASNALEANEFNPDWDTQAVLTEEIQRMAKRIEELEAHGEPVAWLNPYGGVLQRLDTGLEKLTYTIPLYTTPPQRKKD